MLVLSSHFKFYSVWVSSPGDGAAHSNSGSGYFNQLNIKKKSLTDRPRVFPMMILIPVRITSAPKQLRNEKVSMLNLDNRKPRTQDTLS